MQRNDAAHTSQVRLESQSLEVQAKHVRMQALKFGADHKEIANMLREETTLSDEQVRERKFPWRLPDASMRLGEQAGTGSQAKVYVTYSARRARERTNVHTHTRTICIDCLRLQARVGPCNVVRQRGDLCGCRRTHLVLSLCVVDAACHRRRMHNANMFD